LIGTSARYESQTEEVAVNRFKVVFARALRPSTILVVFLLAALVLVGAVSAGSGGSYKGKTKEGFPVKFRVSGKYVTGFNLAGNASCIAWHSVSGEIGAIKAKEKGLLKAGGRFVIEYQTDSTYANITGRVSGSSASGRAKFHYTKSMGAEAGTCWVKTTWSAKQTG
jgi:hypothetical protein